MTTTGNRSRKSMIQETNSVSGVSGVLGREEVSSDSPEGCASKNTAEVSRA